MAEIIGLDRSPIVTDAGRGRRASGSRSPRATCPSTGGAGRGRRLGLVREALIVGAEVVVVVVVGIVLPICRRRT